MKKKYYQAYLRVLAEVQELEDAADAKLELSKEVRNFVILSGQIIGKDTREKIDQIGRKHGLHIFDQQLSIMYRENEK